MVRSADFRHKLPPMATALSTEFRLMLECCRWSFGGGDRAAAEDACAGVDWARFQRLIRFHRVQGLVWNCISQTGLPLPPAIADATAADAQAIVAANLKIARECAQLRSDFEEAAVPLLFVKGLTVGALAYGNPFIKAGWDIDILVPEHGAGQAAELLRTRGYQLSVPRGDAATIEAWHRTHKESTWRRAEQDLHVELHTRLADSRELIPTIGIESPTQLVEVAPGIALPTLRSEELMVYLCVHGASSAWFRLKWITDFAALLNPLQPAEIEALYTRSQELGAGRAAAQALLLADELYGSLRGSALGLRLRGDAGARWLTRLAFRQLVGRGGENREPTSVPLGTGLIHLTQFLLLPGIRFKVGELRRQIRSIQR